MVSFVRCSLRCFSTLRVVVPCAQGGLAPRLVLRPVPTCTLPPLPYVPTTVCTHYRVYPRPYVPTIPGARAVRPHRCGDARRIRGAPVHAGRGMLYSVYTVQRCTALYSCVVYGCIHLYITPRTCRPAPRSCATRALCRAAAWTACSSDPVLIQCGGIVRGRGATDAG